MARLRFPGPRCPLGCNASAGSLTKLEHRALSFRDAPAIKQDPAQTGFFDLSLELREQIYTYALVSSDPIFLGVVSLDVDEPDHWHQPGTLHHGEDKQPPHELSPNALSTCHQLHEEGARMLYGQNTFLVDYSVTWRFKSTFPEWNLSRLAPNTFLPINPVYQELLHEVEIRLHSRYPWREAPDTLSEVMLCVLQGLQGKPNAFISIRLIPVCPRERYVVSAGWSPSGAPSWFPDAQTLPDPSQALSLIEGVMSASETLSAFYKLRTFGGYQPEYPLEGHTRSFEDLDSSMRVIAVGDPGPLCIDWWYPVRKKGPVIKMILARFAPSI